MRGFLYKGENILLKEYYADLHIHIGRTWKGRAVKITGSKNLTLQNILQTASSKKGIDLIGIIDCHSPEVIAELEMLVEEGAVKELDKGGLRYENTTLILGSEIEIYDANCHGPIHVLAYFPTLSIMKSFSVWFSKHVKNVHLSSQRIYCDAVILQQKVKELGGLFIPAHVFTPFKSLYGKGVKHSLTEVFDPSMIDAIELGLSSDTKMVSRITELEQYSFVTNSDAHSLGKMAREYQILRIGDANFLELQMALHNMDGRCVIANYGLHPLLGKYYQTVCAKCEEKVPLETDICLACGSTQIIKGVSTRIEELSSPTELARLRPPYIHQVPLDFIPGLGPKMMEKLLAEFGTEMKIIHDTMVDELAKVIPFKIAERIHFARTGQLQFIVGGGGVYGKVEFE